MTGRKVPEYQGGFLLDGGVHFIAGLRLLLQAAGDEVKQLACFSTLLQERLPPIDSVHSIASTRGGVNGTICLSFGTEFKSALEMEVITTEGSVDWDTKDVTVVRRGASDEKVESRKAFGFDSGVKLEVSSFAKSIGPDGVPDPLQTPEEALKDLQILQALLESGEAKGSLKTLE
jgi:predicted dehydrogenase